jgi:UDP-2,4-diacetamido-2,4,6-trideoxy-beta-L-altropyranose hydrolase
VRIALRVDASVQMGVGHLKRCLALADALRCAGAEPLLVTRDLGLDVAGFLRQHGSFPVRLLAFPRSPSAEDPQAPLHAPWAGVDWQRDAEETVQQLRTIDCDWLIVDSYALDARWHRRVSEELGVRVAAIDDLADRPLAVALLIDHNLADDHQQKYRRSLQHPCRILGGPRFASLGKAFAIAPKYRFREQVQSIGLFLGGTDPAGLTPSVIDACRRVAGFVGPIEIATTSANPALPSLNALCDSDQNLRLCIDQPDLTGFFSRHDLQIGAGGGASWERCCLGAPSITLVTAENQLAVVPMLGAIGASAVLSEGCAPEPEAIGTLVRNLLTDTRLRRSLHENALRLVDGRGAQRIALTIAASHLRVRKATADDAALVHRWRNHEGTRAVSRNTTPIPWAAHQAWFDKTLADARRRMLIGVVGEVPVGVFRFDELADRGEVEVSLYLDPELHGLGLGAALMRAAHADWEQTVAQGEAFVATVMAGNIASQRLFQSAGYKFQSPVWRRPRAARPS